MIRRDRYLRHLNVLCDEVLPRRDCYPVDDDHCFRRVVYDMACRNEWTRAVRHRPFVRYASFQRVVQASRYAVCLWLAREDPGYHWQSLAYRTPDKDPPALFDVQ